MRTNDLVGRRKPIAKPPLGSRPELAEVMIEYALLVALFTVTAIGFITVFGSEISVGSAAIAPQIFGTG